MAITVVQTSTVASGTGTSLATSFGSTTTTGNGIVVAVNYGGNTLSSITDSQGNTYTLARLGNFFNANLSALYYCANPTGGSSFSVTASFSSATSCELQAFEVGGQLTLDVSNGASGNTQNPQAGAITTTGADRIVFCSLRKSGSTITIPTGFTSGYVASNSAAARNVYTSIQTGLNPQWTTNTSTTYACVVAAFSSTMIAADVNVTASFGFSLGQAFSADATQSVTVSKGFALGVAFSPEVNYTVTVSMGITFGNTPEVIPEVREGFALGSDGDFLPTEQFGTVSVGFGLGSRLRADVGELANGRYRR